MLVAISQRQEKNKHGEDIDVMEHSLISYFEKFGIELVVISNKTKNIQNYLEKVEGIILSGGNDIDPLTFGGERKENLSLAPLRDEVEKKMLQFAIEKKIPVLGICRGMQFINVFFGGKIVRESHPVRVNHEIIMEDENTIVNSFHEDAIHEDILSPSLNAFAIANDGVIEAFFHPEYPIVGIQWHPERESPDQEFNSRLIKSFIEKTGYWNK